MEKSEMELSHHHESSNSFLDLSLGFNLDYTPSCSSETISKNAAIATPPGVPSKIFACSYCQRKFYSSQALGGHQNGHKRERMSKKLALTIDTSFAKSMSMSALPLYGSSSTSSSSLQSLPDKVHSVNRLHDQSETRSRLNSGINFIGTANPDDGVEDLVCRESLRIQLAENSLINPTSPAPDASLLSDESDITLRL